MLNLTIINRNTGTYYNDNEYVIGGHCDALRDFIESDEISSEDDRRKKTKRAKKLPSQLLSSDEEQLVYEFV